MMTLITLLLITILLLHCELGESFLVFTQNRNAVIRSRLHESKPASNANELFESEGWRAIQANLDKLPVFCCANKEGKPLAYTVEMNDETFTVPFLYCDVTDAEAELKEAQSKMPHRDGLGLIPVPLGKAFELWAKDKAVLIPSKEAIQQAGAPPDANPIGQQVPLFCCMEIMQTNEEGTEAALPIFMVLEEANAAIAQAVETDGGDPNDFEVVCLSLQRAVELLATVADAPAFQFMAPTKSLEYIDDYLS